MSSLSFPPILRSPANTRGHPAEGEDEVCWEDALNPFPSPAIRPLDMAEQEYAQQEEDRILAGLCDPADYPHLASGNADGELEDTFHIDFD